MITGRNKELLAKVTEDIQRIAPSTKVAAISSEAGSESDTKDLWAQVKNEIGIIDVLICNAGVFSEIDGFPIIGNMNPSVWWSDLVRSLKSPCEVDG